MVQPEDLIVKTLGPCKFDSPIADLLAQRESASGIGVTDRMLFDDSVAKLAAQTMPVDKLPSFEPSGPLPRIFFDPDTTRAGIVTCGGLCPGLNDVIRGLTMVLWHRYKVRNIEGYRYGFEGLNPAFGHEVVEMYPNFITHIHHHGGTILGSSRGPQDTNVMLDFLIKRGVNILFTVGGDGTLRAACELAQEAQRRGAALSVIGIPKTIDNDIMFVEQSFGFQTAFSCAVDAIDAAHIEALGARNGVGLVKVMGRSSGFVAAYAAVANNDANFVLVPEVDFALDGPGGLLNALEKRLHERSHAVIVVAEGAGQEYCQTHGADASGNKKLGDIGLVLKERIIQHMIKRGKEITVKYIDPSYTIRSGRANPHDSVYCFRLAAYAVHGAMSGRTEMIVGRWHGRYVNIPIKLAIHDRQRVDPHGDLWLSVLEATGQPRNMK